MKLTSLRYVGCVTHRLYLIAISHYWRSLGTKTGLDTTIKNIVGKECCRISHIYSVYIVYVIYEMYIHMYA
jgi:hypothetical protein